MDWRALVYKISTRNDNNVEGGREDWDYLRDAIEILSPEEYPAFTQLLVPIVVKILGNETLDDEPISIVFRNSVLGCVRILPTFGEYLKPYVEDLARVSLHIIRNDHEENSAEALQFFIDLHKVYRGALESYVRPYLDYILELASDFENILSRYVEEARKTPIVNSSPKNRLSRHSLKMLHDSPVMIVLLFQLHRRFIAEYVPKLVPLIIQVLEVDLEKPKCGLPEIESLDQIGNEPLSAYRLVFGDFIACQVKILSFLAYIARGFSASLKDYFDLIPRIIIRLLCRCPPEGVPSRKELLVAVRHILSTEVRPAFIPYLEDLMDESLLLGDGYTAFYVFRPAAFSMLADLIHHVRTELGQSQLEKIIEIYGGVMHDPTLPNGIQTMSVKLLLNLIDVIMSDQFSISLKSNLLRKIFVNVIIKFDWMKKIVSEMGNREASKKSDGFPFEKQFDLFFDDALSSRPIPTDHIALDASRDSVRDLKFQLKTLITGLKSLFLAFRSLKGTSKDRDGNMDAIQASEASLDPMDDDLDAFAIDLFRDGISCFDLLRPTITSTPTYDMLEPSQTTLESSALKKPQMAGHSISTEDKELMDQFAYVFTLLEPPKFQEVVDASIDFLIDRAYENLWLVAIPQYFLAISGVSRDFAKILSKSLMRRLEDLGTQGGRSAVVMRLFKLLFLAVSVYPEENESVLQPILSEIILVCFRLYPCASVPANYLLLLRSLFRSIGGGRFDSLYKEILPLLPNILEELSLLWPMHASAWPKNVYMEFRDIYIELCLTTPVRLSNLLPHLTYLMKPVSLALNSTGDLLNQGLRTLELCLDNLTPDFLDPILDPVFDKILESLYGMLRANGTNSVQSHTAVRLLGKLGGRSRRSLVSSNRPFLKPGNAHIYAANDNVDESAFPTFMQALDLSTYVAVDGGIMSELHIACGPVIASALKLLDVSTDMVLRKESISFLCNCITRIFHNHDIRGCSKLVDQKLEIIQSVESGFQSTKDFPMQSIFGERSAASVGERSTLPPDSAILREIVCAIVNSFFTILQQGNRSEVDMVKPFLTRLFQFIAMLYASRVDHPFLSCVNFDALIEALVRCGTQFSNEYPQQQPTWDIIRAVHEEYSERIPNKELQFELRILFLLTDKIMAACFESSILSRVSACRMISRFCDLDLSPRFFLHHEVRFVRGILFVMKSLPSTLGQKYSEELTGIIFKVLKLVNKGAQENSMLIDSNEGGKSPSPIVQDWAELKKQNFEQMLSMLVSELSNPNDLVRKTVKSCIQLLSDIRGCEVTDLLSPLKARICTPIFAKPLRALPVHVQIGYTDAITYCLSLRPPLIEISDELLRLIDEAITLIESEETSNPVGGAQSSVKSIHSALQALKIICIRLLSACISEVEFQQMSRLHSLRNQIVSLFFRTLYSKQGELVNVARDALEQMIAQQHKLPTDVLQNGLRPVLQSLSEPKQLTVSAVEGLRRVFQLFSHFFKAEIGRKLLDHLQSLSDHYSASIKKTIVPGDSNPSPPNEAGWDLRVVPAIIDLFSIIPNCGPLLMDELILVVLKLEKVLRRKFSSPFRAPLLRLLELYPSEAVRVLIERPREIGVVSLFSSLVAQSNCAKIFVEFIKMFNIIKEILTQPGANFRLCCAYLKLLKILYQRGGSSLKLSVKEHSDFINELWKNNSLRATDEFATKLIFELTFAFLTSNPDQITCAFAPLVFANNAFTLYEADLPRVYRDWLKRCSPAQQQSILVHWIGLYGTGLHLRIIAKSTRWIALPLVAQSVRSEDEFSSLITQDVIEMAKNAIWLRDCRSCLDGSCVIAIEELQWTFLVGQSSWRRLFGLSQDCKKYIIKFLLNRMQSLDCSVIYSSLLIFSSLILEEVDDKTLALNKPKEASSIYLLNLLKSLLKAPCADIRMVLRQAFDALLPYFAGQNDGIRDSAVLLVSEALTRDGYLLTLVLGLWQSICNNASALLPIAPFLVKPLVMSFTKCAPLTLSSPEGKYTALDIAEVLLKWAQESHKVYAVFQGRPSLVDHLLNGIIRWSSSLSDYSDSSVLDRVLNLINLFSVERDSKSLIMLTEGRPLKLQPLDRLINSPDINEDNSPFVVAGYRILQKCLAIRKPQLIEGDIAQLSKWIRFGFDRISNAKVLTHFSAILEFLFSSLAAYLGKNSTKETMIESEASMTSLERTINPWESLRSLLENSIIENLSSGRNAATAFHALLACPLPLLDLVSSSSGLEMLFQQFCRCFQKLARDYLSGHVDEAKIPNVPLPSASDMHDRHRNLQFIVNSTIIPGIEFGVRFLGRSDFPQSQFLNCLQQLWEHGKSLDLLLCVISHFLKWMDDEVRPGTEFLSINERSELLLAPCGFMESHSDVGGSRILMEKYFEIILKIYSKPVYEKSNLRRKLEGSFLRGLCFGSDLTNPSHPAWILHTRFSEILNAHVPCTFTARLSQVFGAQKWSLVGSTYWLTGALTFLMQPINIPASVVDEKEETYVDLLLNDLNNVRTDLSVSEQISLLLYFRKDEAHYFWKNLLSAVWPSLGSETKKKFWHHCLQLISADDSLAQVSSKPSIVSTLMESMVEIDMRYETGLKIPATLLAYLSKIFGCWYQSVSYLEGLLDRKVPDYDHSSTTARDSLWYEYATIAEKIFQWLGEYDYGFAVIRRSSYLPETNISMSFDQLGLVSTAQKLYETAMTKCRAGTVPYNDYDFCYWEDHWARCGRTLQQWDLLTELARQDENPELGLECLWRLADWGGMETINAAYGLLRSLPVPSLRHKYFEAFMALSPSSPSSGNALTSDRVGAFQNAMEEAITMGLHEWRSLPPVLCFAHGFILHMFQMIVELQESVALFSNLVGGIPNALARPQIVSEIKSLLTAWRERLPNDCDEMELWSDILAWRQHVFSIINTAFAPLVMASANSNVSNTDGSGTTPTTSSTHPLTFRGYHEMAWLINRFSHVARKYGLLDICLSFLNRIYSLPNIEIQDAFLKLREQTKCFMGDPADLPNALDVINATNLNYFSSIQKAEFFVLRAVILSRLGMVDEANRVFAQSVQIDLNLAKGWSKWGQFNDHRFIQGHDINYALNAINCYLQAATLYKAHRSRRFLARILWLLTFDDNSSSLGKSFEMYNSDLPTWYWLCFIPQLLSSLCRQEQRQARLVLLKIAKSYPQAIYLPMRSFHDECRISKISNPQRPQVMESQTQSTTPLSQISHGESPEGSPQNVEVPPTSTSSSQNPNTRKPVIDCGEEIFNILKTAHPLLALTLENMLEHIIHRLRATIDEDFYRVLTSLTGEVYQHIMSLYSSSVKNPQINSIIESSLRRVQMMIANAPNLNPNYRAEFEQDFFPGGVINLDPEELLQKLFSWRVKIEPILRRHPKQLVLDGLSRVLAEFEYHRFEDIDVLGQYLLLKDGNQDFVKIEKFEPGVAVVRRHGVSFRRLVIRGSDGILYPFVVQNPAGRQIRREERIFQIFRFIDHSIRRNIFSRRRALFVNVPAIVTISSHVRMIPDDPASATYEEILQKFIETLGIDNCDEVFIKFKEKLKNAVTLLTKSSSSQDATAEGGHKLNVEILNIRTEIFADLSTTLIPNYVLEKYISKLFSNLGDKWIFRRDFTRNYALMIFLNFVFAIGHRFLHKFGFLTTNGTNFQNEVLPTVTASGQISLIEIVPFRYTPNLQRFITPIGTEGPLLSSIAVGARSSSKTDSELAELLPLFMRDELLLWYLNYCALHHSNTQEEASGTTTTAMNRIVVTGEIAENPFEKLANAGVDEKTFLSRVLQNCELIMKRLQSISCIKEEEQLTDHSVPVFQSILDLLSSATNPQKLAQMDGHWHPWF